MAKEKVLTETELAEVSEKVVTKKRGRGGTENFPSVISGAKAADVSRCLENCMAFYELPLVSSDEECRERLAWFFSTCQETGQFPSVEKMFLALGAAKSTVWNWENGIGCSSTRMNLIKKAKDFIHAFEAEMAQEGHINAVVYIFRAKNYFGMKDQQDVTIRPVRPLGDIPDTSDLQKRITGTVVLD